MAKGGGGGGSSSLTATAIGIVVVIIAVAILFPIAGKLIFNANMTGWDSTSKSTFPLIFLVGVAAIIIGLVVKSFHHR